MRDAVESIGQPPAHVQPQHLGLDDGPTELADLLGIVGRRARLRTRAGELLDELGVATGEAQLAGLALVADDGHGQRPAVARRADHVGGRHAGLVEDDLAELLGDPVDHLQRPLLDAGLVHRHREGGDALVLGHVVIGAGQHEAAVGVVGVARPDLVPGDDVLVAVAVGPGAQRGEVRAGVGLAEALAPPVAPVDDAGQEPLLDVVVAVLEDALDQVAEARPRRRAGARPAPRRGSRRRRSAAPGRRSRAATTCRRSRRRTATGATRPCRPSTRRRSTRWAGPGCWPRARRAAAAGTRPRRASHRSPSPTSDPVVVEHPLEAGARRRRARRSTAWPGAGGRGPGTPRCCRCRRAPGWRSRTRRAPPARSRPWPPRPPPARRRAPARRPPRRRAGRRCAIPPSATNASASRCCTAWNDPMADAVLAPLRRRTRRRGRPRRAWCRPGRRRSAPARARSRPRGRRR